MPQAISIHLGLSAVDAHVYRGWSGPLRGCENDAHAMQAIADARRARSRRSIETSATDTPLVQVEVHDLLVKKPCYAQIGVAGG